MAALPQTVTANNTTYSITGDNPPVSADMFITFPTVRQANAQSNFAGQAVEFDGDGGRGGLDDLDSNSSTPTVEVFFYEDGTSGTTNVAIEVTDVTFTWSDIDADNTPPTSWHDEIRIVAYDKDGNEVPVTVDLSGTSIVVNNTVTTGTAVQGTLTSDGDDAIFTVAGPVHRIEMYYEDGLDRSNDDGAVGFGMDSIGDVLCFTKGTLISTPTGPKPIERLAPGDCVETKGHGSQQIIWLGESTHKTNARTWPIKIIAGALGNSTDLILSPLHRILIDGWRAELLFGQDAVLVPAKDLVNGDTIFAMPCSEVTYYHILLEDHHLVLSNGIWTESFFPGPQALQTLSPRALHDLQDIMPKVAAKSHRIKTCLAQPKSRDTRAIRGFARAI